MLTVFLVVQAMINGGLLIAFLLLLRERTRTASLAAAREDRLEELAAEFCALGQALTSASPPVAKRAGPPRKAPEIPPARAFQPKEFEPDNLTAPEPVPSIPAAIHDTRSGVDTEAAATTPTLPSEPIADRLKEAAALLDLGQSVAAVAAKTAIPDGEVQVLRNLRRGQTAPTRRRGEGARKRPALATA
jgi:hypothetical protein